MLYLLSKKNIKNIIQNLYLYIYIYNKYLSIIYYLMRLHNTKILINSIVNTNYNSCA